MTLDHSQKTFTIIPLIYKTNYKTGKTLIPDL